MKMQDLDKNSSHSVWLCVFLIWQKRKNKTGNLKYGQIIEGLESQSKKVRGPFIQLFQEYLLSVAMCQAEFR